MSTVNQIDGLVGRNGEILTVEARCTVAKAARKMRSNRIGCVLVIDRLQRIAGILTEQGILEKVVAAAKDPKRIPVDQAMNRKVVSCKLDTPLEEARRLMAENQVSYLPIIEGSVPVAILSSKDLLAHQLSVAQAAAREQSELVARLQDSRPQTGALPADRVVRAAS
jgi:CBS domain-containing protein